MRASITASAIAISSVLATSLYAATIDINTTIEATGSSASTDNPPCESSQQARDIKQIITTQGLNAIGQASSSLGLGDNPFNIRRINQSICMDLCAVLPPKTSFTARGSITPIDWQGNLSPDLPSTINPGIYAAVTGPTVESTNKGDVVCYTYKNWSHDKLRNINLRIDY